MPAGPARLDGHGPRRGRIPDCVARALYGEERAVHVAALAEALDAGQFATVLTALLAYRQDVEPLQVAAALPAQAGREEGAAAPAPREVGRPPPDDCP